MFEQLEKKVNKIRQRLSLNFLLILYVGCTIFNVFFAQYIELGLILIGITSLIWAIKKTDLEYTKIQDSIKEYKKTNDLFVINGLINFKTVFLFIASFTMFLTIQQLIHPISNFGAFFGFFLYISIVMFAINGEYNPLALEKQHKAKKDSNNIHDEYIFSQDIDESRRDISDIWYDDPCLPGNPIYHINK